MFKFRHTDPRKQFSKWLAKYGSIIWGIYIFVIIALIAYQPETAMACVYLTIIVTINKAWDAYQYNDNSKTEKILLAMLDKVNMEINIGGKAKGSVDDEEAITEGESNG